MQATETNFHYHWCSVDGCSALVKCPFINEHKAGVCRGVRDGLTCEEHKNVIAFPSGVDITAPSVDNRE
jgi:hypothetical protein